MTSISREHYQQLVNKLTQGRPTQYWFNRIDIKNYTSTDRKAKLYLWPSPDQSSSYKMVYWIMKRMEDAGLSAESNVPIPDRFLPAYVTTLASKIAMKSKDPEVIQRYPVLKAEGESLFIKARENDRDRSTFKVRPRIMGI